MRKLTLASAVIFFSLAMPRPAGAWGLSNELNESWAKARLVFPVLQNKRLRYCLQNEAPDRFTDASLALQVEAALGLWLSAADMNGTLPIERVPCEDESLNLLVRFGGESEWKNLGSYQLSSGDERHYYSLVKFDTGFESVIDGKTYPIVDFRNYAPDLPGEGNLLHDLSRRPATVRAFALDHGLDPNAVFWSTFPSFLHELGHSFGLCDTYDATVKDECDPAYQSATQPSSVMKGADYLYLTDDDVTAIRQLFARFRRSPARALGKTRAIE